MLFSVSEDAGQWRDDRQRTENQVQPALEQNPLWRSVQAPPYRYTLTHILSLATEVCLCLQCWRYAEVHPLSFRCLFCPPPLYTCLPPPLPEGANFRSVLDKAIQADQVVKDRYNTHCEMIALLCKPENELNAAIPSANPAKTLQGSEVWPFICFCMTSWCEILCSYCLF